MMNLKTLLNKSWRQIPKWLPIVFLVGGFIGFIVSPYISVLHFKIVFPRCFLGECETVLTSQYATIFGIPNALLGGLYYLAVITFAVLYMDTKHPKYILAAMTAIMVGFVFTLWFVYLQAFVIKAFCEYCLLSAGVTFILFVGTLFYCYGQKEKERV